ncbi:hypothetical protein A2U01_0070713 [Trifolium medium]|uniref:Uncharacterized protein n=1 Tax=Trifolium medium TaxID=97028 RepID=A0A392SLC2_9FABA|nr:hypothetical protein [Trifolium medium]
MKKWKNGVWYGGRTVTATATWWTGRWFNVSRKERNR